MVFLVRYQLKKDRYVVPSLTDYAKVKRYSYSQLVKKIANYSIPITFCIGMQYFGNLIDLGITKSRLLVLGLLIFRHLSFIAIYININN